MSDASPVEVRTANVGGYETTSAHTFSRTASARVECDWRKGHARDGLALLCRVVLEVILAARKS